MHAVIRRYRVRLGTVEQAARYADKWFVPLVRKLPGFVMYYLLDAGNDTLASIGLFESRDGAESAAQLARDWFEDEWPSFRPLPPEVVSLRDKFSHTPWWRWICSIGGTLPSARTRSGLNPTM